jgi:hypothetical protein
MRRRIHVSNTVLIILTCHMRRRIHVIWGRGCMLAVLVRDLVCQLVWGDTEGMHVIWGGGYMHLYVTWSANLYERTPRGCPGGRSGSTHLLTTVVSPCKKKLKKKVSTWSALVCHILVCERRQFPTADNRRDIV